MGLLTLWPVIQSHCCITLCLFLGMTTKIRRGDLRVLEMGVPWEGTHLCWRFSRADGWEVYDHGYVVRGQLSGTGSLSIGFYGVIVWTVHTQEPGVPPSPTPPSIVLITKGQYDKSLLKANATHIWVTMVSYIPYAMLHTCPPLKSKSSCLLSLSPSMLPTLPPFPSPSHLYLSRTQRRPFTSPPSSLNNKSLLWGLLCEFCGASWPSYRQDTLFAENHLQSSTTSTSYIVSSPLSNRFPSLDGRGVMKTSHLGLSAPRSLTLHTVVGLCVNDQLQDLTM